MKNILKLAILPWAKYWAKYNPFKQLQQLKPLKLFKLLLNLLQNLLLNFLPNPLINLVFKQMFKPTYKPMYLLGFVGILLMAASCVKFEPLTSPRESTVFMSQSGSLNTSLLIYRVDSTKTVTFGASIGGFQKATEDIQVSFEVDNALIKAYNDDHAFLNYNFVPLPEDAYKISGLQSTIKKGYSDSDPLSFTILVNKLDQNLDYCLPIRISKTSKGSLDSVSSITYFVIDSLYIRKKDVTLPSTIYVSNENDDGPNSPEGSSRLVDNDINTKFLSFNFNPGFWIELMMADPVKIDAYTLTSGNDAPERDPKDWTLLGSNDHTNWTLLDKRNGYGFLDRGQTATFELNHPDGQPYLFYRLAITATGEGEEGLFQMSEWRLIQYY